MKYYGGMLTTGYPEIKKLLAELVITLTSTLEQNLAGIYFYGSLATGDFDESLSDIDLLVVTNKIVDQKIVAKLNNMHNDFSTSNTKWSKRIDIAYISKEDLEHFKVKVSKVAVSCDAEPLKIVNAPDYYLIDWYKVQEHGMTLFGPPASTVIPRITSQEFTEAIRSYMLNWPRKVKDAKTHSAQAYIVLTMCRCLYALKNGEHTSKKDSAQWAKYEYPQWAKLIDNSIKWSRKKDTDEIEDTKNQIKISEFVKFIITEAS